jgi:putative Flp pilus-assembly TadE/G-like protein
MKYFARTLKVDFWPQDEGQALVLTCVGLFVLLLMAGYGVDIGYLRYQKHQMQKAADAGALGAAQAKLDGSDWRLAGQHDSKINGFEDGRDGTTVAVNNPPTRGPMAGLDDYVEVIVSQPRPNFFMKLLGSGTTNVSSRAVATVNGSASGCIYALDPTSNQTLRLNGTPDVSASCGVYVNSNDRDALHIDGNATLSAGTAGAGIGVVGPDGGGGWNSRCDSGGCLPTPVNIPHFEDPLIHLAAPDVSGLSCSTYTGGDPVPNIKYCGGMDIHGSGTVHFVPGQYYIYGGGLTISGSVTVTGTGVTIYNTGTNSGPNAYGPVRIASNLSISLSAPTSGTYAGILFFSQFLDRSHTSTSTSDESRFGGGNNETLTGALYFPGTNVRYAGNPTATVSSLVIAWQVQFDGTAQLNNHLLLGGGSPIQTAALSE